MRKRLRLLAKGLDKSKKFPYLAAMSFNPNQPRDRDGKWEPKLLSSLERQLAKRGEKEPHKLAVEILAEQGSINPKTEQLTAKGREREQMGREGRAKDRLASQTGHKAEHLVYDKRLKKAFVS